jgi:hypothetical protein
MFLHGLLYNMMVTSSSHTVGDGNEGSSVEEKLLGTVVLTLTRSEMIWYMNDSYVNEDI